MTTQKNAMCKNEIREKLITFLKSKEVDTSKYKSLQIILMKSTQYSNSEQKKLLNEVLVVISDSRFRYSDELMMRLTQQVKRKF